MLQNKRGASAKSSLRPKGAQREKGPLYGRNRCLIIFSWLSIAMLLTPGTSAANTSTTKPVGERVTESWNNVLCTVLKVLEYTSIGLAAITMIVAGVRFMSSGDDPESRQKSKQMIIQVLAGIVLIFSAVQTVNYLATGTKIERFDMNACNVSFGGAPPVNATNATTTTTRGGVNSSTTSSSTRLITTSTTNPGPVSCLSPVSATALHQINACEWAQEWRHAYPDEDQCDYLGTGNVVTPECCCTQVCKCCSENPSLPACSPP